MTRTALLLAAALVLPGCMSAELARVRRDLSADLPAARISRASAPHIGRLPLALARLIVGGEVGDALRPVRGVAVGRYAVRGTLAGGAGRLRAAESGLARRGWEPVVAVRDSSETTYVYARTRGDVLRDLLVVAFEGDGLTLVRVTGRIDGPALARLVGSTGGPLDGPLDGLGGLAGTARARPQADAGRAGDAAP